MSLMLMSPAKVILKTRKFLASQTNKKGVEQNFGERYIILQWSW